MIPIIIVNPLFQPIIFIDSMAVCGTISSTNITIFNLTIHILKGTLFITLGESVDVYKTIYTTHISLIGIPIMLR